jgi:hypothetical protein
MFSEYCEKIKSLEGNSYSYQMKSIFKAGMITYILPFVSLHSIVKFLNKIYSAAPVWNITNMKIVLCAYYKTSVPNSSYLGYLSYFNIHNVRFCEFHSRYALVLFHAYPTRNMPKSKCLQGRAAAQAISRWLPTAAARVCVREACGVCGEQSGTGADFLRVLRFPLPIIPPISPSS